MIEDFDFDVEDAIEWLERCKEQGHLNEWDVSTQISNCQNLFDLQELLCKLIESEILAINKG